MHLQTREAKFQPDPLNRQHVSGPTSDSLVELPDAPPQQWILPRDETPKGQLKKLPFVSKILGNEEDAHDLHALVFLLGKQSIAP